jgi:hypothetical protein
MKIGCTTPENDLICFILVMGILPTYNGAVGMTFEQEELAQEGKF